MPQPSGQPVRWVLTRGCWMCIRHRCDAQCITNKQVSFSSPRLCSSLCTVLPHNRCYDAAVRPWSVLRRWNAGLKLGWRMASGFLDRVARQSPASRAPVLSVEVSAAALLLHFDTAALTTLLGVAAVVMHFGQYSRHRRLRPQVTCTPAACGDWVLLQSLLVHHAQTHQALALQSMEK